MDMDGAATNDAVFDETVIFLSHFKNLQDPRQPGKISYPLDEILPLCLLAVLAGAECFTEIALVRGQKAWVASSLSPVQGWHTAHDHLGDILATLNAKQFQACFVAWVAAVTGLPAGGDRD
jgi:hypothetical protein